MTTDSSGEVRGDFWKRAYEAASERADLAEKELRAARELYSSQYVRRTEIPGVEVIDSHELFAASELEIERCRLPSGEVVFRFVDCTERPPIIYKWCFEDAVRWLATGDISNSSISSESK